MLCVNHAYQKDVENKPRLIIENKLNGVNQGQK